MMKRNRQRGTGQGSQSGSGSTNKPFKSGPGGNCRCPKCNYTETHAPGTPCKTKKCPQCGTQMIRE